MLTAIEIQSFVDASAFLAALRPSGPQWEGERELYTGWIFRGQSNARWPLRPSGFRRSNCSRLLLRYLRTYQARFRDQNWQDWVQPTIDLPAATSTAVFDRRIAPASLHALAQAALVRDFVLLADRAGHPTSRPDFLWHLENQKEHSHSLGCFFRGKVENDDMEAFAIAQHHGIPTGLLDWTYNPLVATFFAAEPTVKRAAVECQHIAVWALRSSLFKRNWPERRRLTVTPGKVPFLDAQQGLFTWCPTAYEWYLREGKYPTLNEIASRIVADPLYPTASTPLLRKLTLPVAQVSALLKLLWRENVTRAHLMPTYDNVTASLHLQSHLTLQVDHAAQSTSVGNSACPRGPTSA